MKDLDSISLQTQCTCCTKDFRKREECQRFEIGVKIGSLVSCVWQCLCFWPWKNACLWVRLFHGQFIIGSIGQIFQIMIRKNCHGTIIKVTAGEKIMTKWDLSIFDIFLKETGLLRLRHAENYRTRTNILALDFVLLIMFFILVWFRFRWLRGKWCWCWWLVIGVGGCWWLRGRGVYVGDCVCGREEMRQASYGHCQPLGAYSHYVACCKHQALIWSVRLKSYKSALKQW